jgi:WD40 repeat protein
VGASTSAGQILFFSAREINQHLFIIKADGSAIMQLTHVDGEAAKSPVWIDAYLFPAISSDGERIAVSAVRTADAIDSGIFSPETKFPLDIYTLNIDGSNIQRLTNKGNNLSPTWSPDGSKIMFASDRSGNLEIYVMNSDGSSLRRLTNHPAADMSPRWSPDGKQVVFMSGRNKGWNLYLMKPDGSSVRQLTKNGLKNIDPAWSPDGKQIVYVTESEDNPDIYIMDSNGTNIRRLTTQPGDDSSPAWSPDGTHIAFMTNRDGNYEVYVMNSDGSEQHNLTQNSSDDGGPVWIIHPTTQDFDPDICTVTALHKVSVRKGPGLNFATQGSLATEQQSEVTGRAEAANGDLWWRLANGTWVRSDLVTASYLCSDVPIVKP